MQVVVVAVDTVRVKEGKKETCGVHQYSDSGRWWWLTGVNASSARALVCRCGIDKEKKKLVTLM